LAFHMKLREDISEMIREQNAKIPVDGIDETLHQTESQNLNSSLKDTQNEKEKSDSNKDTVRALLQNDSEVTEFEKDERYNGGIPLDLIHLEKTDILVNWYDKDNKTENYQIINPIVKQATVHQLPHIGNESRSLRRSDRKIHTLPHIGNECNLREMLDDNINYVYN